MMDQQPLHKHSGVTTPESGLDRPRFFTDDLVVTRATGLESAWLILTAAAADGQGPQPAVERVFDAQVSARERLFLSR